MALAPLKSTARIRKPARRTQVLRVPGTLHLKDPANPHLVRIVEELTTERIYTAAEVAAAFPPRVTQPSRRRAGSRASATSNRRAGGAQAEPGMDWQPDQILSALLAIDARLQASGPFTAQGDRPDDQAIVVDWSQRDWWLRAMACLHHASGGSDEGFRALLCRKRRRCLHGPCRLPFQVLRRGPAPRLGQLGGRRASRAARCRGHHPDHLLDRAALLWLAGQPPRAGLWDSRGPIGKFLRRLRPWQKLGNGQCRSASIAFVR